MLEFKIKNDMMQKLSEAVELSGRNLQRELTAAVNATAKKVSLDISRSVGKELAAPAAVIKKQMNTKKASPKSTTGTESKVTLSKSKRIPLRDFGARQTRSGVSYKTSKTRGRKTAPGAFQGPKPGLIKASWRGRVFRRAGKAKLPIQQLFGPSPWGVFVKNNMLTPATAETQAELAKQIERRIKFNILKAIGEI